MVNTITNRKPVRIHENDNIFSKDYISNKGKAVIKNQTVQINDVIIPQRG